MALNLVYNTNNIDIEKQNWAFVHEMSPRSFDAFKHNCIQVLTDLHSFGILNVSKRTADFDNAQITVQDNIYEEVKSINQYYDKDETYTEISNRLENYYTPLSDTINVGLETIQNFLVPNIKYDAELTAKLRSEAVSNVAVSRGFVLKDEEIVGKNKRITDEDYRKIQSLLQYLSEQSPHSGVLMFLGQAGFLFIIMLMFVMYLNQFRKKILKNVKNLRTHGMLPV